MRLLGYLLAGVLDTTRSLDAIELNHQIKNQVMVQVSLDARAFHLSCHHLISFPFHRPFTRGSAHVGRLP